MNLLIITQKVDRMDPILGFFHRWIEEFAQHCESVVVIGQWVGEYHFPENVTVYSLGKEGGAWRLVQVARFHWLLWKLRKEYHAVFVHMTPIWVVLGWKVWFFLRAPVYLWYEARGTRWPLRIALLFIRKVFSASKSGMPLRTRKSVTTGHGIDIPPFLPSVPRREPLILTVGRITVSKQLPALLYVFATLPREYCFRIAGVPVTKADKKLLTDLLSSLRELGIEDRVEIQQADVGEVQDLLRRATLFLHASVTSLDKALLEAMAHSCLIVSCAEVARSVLPPQCLATPATMAGAARCILDLPPAQQDDLRRTLHAIVERDHSLQKLIPRLITEMQ